MGCEFRCRSQASKCGQWTAVVQDTTGPGTDPGCVRLKTSSEVGEQLGYLRAPAAQPGGDRLDRGDERLTGAGHCSC